MNRRRRITPGEMEILAMLWEEGPLGLADAHRRFGRYGPPVGYPTMQTRLNRMAAKGLVRRSGDRPAVYEAAFSREQAAAGHLDLLLQTARQVNVVPLIAHLIAERSLTSDEIRELKKLLAEADRATPTREPQGD